MKCVAKGFLGALLVLILVALIYTQYSDYRAAAETSGWLNDIDETKTNIEKNILRNKSTIRSGEDIQMPTFHVPTPPTYTKIMNNGTIILKGGREGQLVVLVPTFTNTEVIWSCVGGSSKATIGCKNAP
jgi:hypothetical protein